jgi:FkbM family methyltransferase
MKSCIKRVLKRLGVEVGLSRNNPTLIDFIETRQIDVVLDVGANVGQFGKALRSRGYRGKIISFEPVKSEFQKLATVANADGNWETHNIALGAAPGKAEINVSQNSVFSSLLNLTSDATQFDSSTVISHREAIEVRTLDEVARNISGNILLKIDTQGYEKQVLEGGRHTLVRLKGALIELPISQLYEGNWQFYEALEFMASAGFIPAQIHPVSFHESDRVSFVEIDCLFRPRHSLLD